MEQYPCRRIRRHIRSDLASVSPNGVSVVRVRGLRADCGSLGPGLINSLPGSAHSGTARNQPDRCVLLSSGAGRRHQWSSQIAGDAVSGHEQSGAMSPEGYQPAPSDSVDLATLIVQRSARPRRASPCVCTQFSEDSSPSLAALHSSSSTSHSSPDCANGFGSRIFCGLPHWPYRLCSPETPRRGRHPSDGLAGYSRHRGSRRFAPTRAVPAEPF